MSKITRILQAYVVVMWTAYGQVCVQTGKVILGLSTLPTAIGLSSQIVQSYTQFCMRHTAGLSTAIRHVFTAVIYEDIHTIHLAYNYNYIYIKKGY